MGNSDFQKKNATCVSILIFTYETNHSILNGGYRYLFRVQTKIINCIDLQSKLRINVNSLAAELYFQC